MRVRQRYGRLDQFRILAAALVVAIHTSPLASFSTGADFFLTRVLGRIAVPFFFMVTGQFIVSSFPECGRKRVLDYVKKIAFLYAVSIIIYLPIGIYAGQYQKLNVADALRMLIFDGTFYHLWYFPACMLGVFLVYAMSCFLNRGQMMIAAAVLYAAGLFGDSYYGFVENVPVIQSIYEAGFQVFSYTRNGIFMAPIFLLLGEAQEEEVKREEDLRFLWAGLCAAFAAMTIEAFLVRKFEMQRHDRIYFFLLPVMYFLYKLLIFDAGQENAGLRSKRRGRLTRYLGTAATWIYILHPAMIVVIRGIAKVIKWNLLIENSLIHYLAVFFSSLAAAAVISIFLDRIHQRVQEQRRHLVHKGRTIHRSGEQTEAANFVENQEENAERMHKRKLLINKTEDKAKNKAKEKISLKRKENLRGAIQDAHTEEFSCGRAWLELDHIALQHNVSMLRSRLPASCRLMPAVKADAYGHGAVLIAGELQKMGVDAFCVACVQEGILLRKKGIYGEILILGYTHPEQFELLCRYHLTQTVIDYEYAVQLNQYGEDIHVHIGIDTGMHRLGERSDNIAQILAMYQMEHLIVDGLYTHLSASDTQQVYGRAYTSRQAEAFYQAVQTIKEYGYPCPKLHMLASYGVLNYPELAGDYARVGIALYGVLSTKADTMSWQEDLQPVLSLKVRIATVKTLYQGESAGYGLKYTADRDRRIATLAIGYADGLPRSLSEGAGSVLIHGRRAPIIGRICMDQTIVDVSGIEDVCAGDTAVLIGHSGSLEISVCDLAAQAGTITNEILSRMGARLERVIV